MDNPRDHGGGIDAAVARYGGTRRDWLDLSTGINAHPYPVPQFGPEIWSALPDTAAFTALEQAARQFWGVPDEAAVLSAAGASALIAQLPHLITNPPAVTAPHVYIPGPTYNEHAAAFRAHGAQVTTTSRHVPPYAPTQAQVFVNPNNPDGAIWGENILQTHDQLTIIDESFCDICPQHSLIRLTRRKNVVVLKSFGKFWGLAGMRLGFAIGHRDTLAPLKDGLGPWQVSGPALEIGRHALHDHSWSRTTRRRLRKETARLDKILRHAGAQLVGGTDLFRLYHVDAAEQWQARLARHYIWSRVFPYSRHWLRLGLPAPDGWSRLEAALLQ